ncbi:RNA-splicing factor [Coemansia asiatica]|uniref:RNA-splicing factor n=1 Tax=Coemansia asiatica TaxID=1052880 RepID=A0A9W7XHT5_9FUNG|nr:RNA-splicing factor [Coemansia asiatica]
MGGGDLNMHKSWHTKTKANRLRVAEEKRKAEEEAQRIANMQKELREERQREEMEFLNASVTKKTINKLDWMYSAPAAHQPQSSEDLEAYLLGKRDAKTILEQKEKEKKPDEKWKAGLFAFSNRNANSEKDLMTKSMEDPLAEIKRREQAAILVMRGGSAAYKEAEKKERRTGKSNEDGKREKRAREEKKHRSESKSSSKDKHRHHRSKHGSDRSHKSRSHRSRSPSHKKRRSRHSSRSRSRSPADRS